MLCYLLWNMYANTLEIQTYNSSNRENRSRHHAMEYSYKFRDTEPICLLQTLS